MRKTWLVIGVIAIVVLGVGAWWVVNDQGEMPAFLTRPAGESPPTPMPPVLTNRAIVAEGTVAPHLYAALSMPASGIVTDLLVQEGDRVVAGNVIARLDSDQEAIAIASAQTRVDQARSQLDQLISGARPEEIAAAQATVASAAARLAILRDGARIEEIAPYEAALSAAQASYQQVAEGADDADLISAKAAIQNAEAALQQAQNAYNRVSWRTDIGALPESAALQRATNDYEAAQARYDDLLAGAEASQLARAGAEVRQARANLDRVKAPPTDNEIAAAEAEVQAAQAALDLRSAGARPEEIAAASAALRQAETELIQRQLVLADRELRAPFDGEIAAMELKIGQQVIAGAPVVQLADTSTWLIETSDLTELNVVDVQEGDEVRVTIDALPDVELAGVVERIRPLGENVQGDITYKVTIRLNETDPRLRWNMTAAVTME